MKNNSKNNNRKSHNVYFITVNNFNNDSNDDVEVCTFINKYHALRYARSLVNAGYYTTININQRNDTTIPLKQWKRVNQKYVVVFDNMYPNMGRQSIVTRRNIFDVIEKYSNI